MAVLSGLKKSAIYDKAIISMLLLHFRCCCCCCCFPHASPILKSWAFHQQKLNIQTNCTNRSMCTWQIDRSNLLLLLFWLCHFCCILAIFHCYIRSTSDLNDWQNRWHSVAYMHSVWHFHKAELYIAKHNIRCASYLENKMKQIGIFHWKRLGTQTHTH